MRSIATSTDFYADDIDVPLATILLRGTNGYDDEDGPYRVTFHAGDGAGHDPRAHNFKSMAAAKKAVTEYVKRHEGKGVSAKRLAEQSAQRANQAAIERERDELRAELARRG